MPRAGLTRALLITDAAIEVDETGWESLTLASLAKGRGVKLPSLYKHVGSLSELRRGVSVRALSELGDTVRRATVGRSGSTALGAMAHAYRSFARKHPGQYDATLAAPEESHTEHVRAAQQLLEAVFAVLAGYGLEGDDAVDAVRIVRSALHGFVAIEAAGGFKMGRMTDTTFDRMVDMLDSTLPLLSEEP